MKKIMLFCLIFSSCVVSKHAANQYSVNYKVLAGVNKGGIVENTDLSLIDHTKPDAFTGATKTGFHAGINVDIPLKRNNIETGLNIITGKQTFTYNDIEHNYEGERDFSVNQIRIPVSYNFLFFKRKSPNGFLQFKLGYSLGYSIIDVQDNSTMLPEYSIRHFSGGVLTGFNIIPVTFGKNANLGFNIELFRGFKPTYIDLYNVGKMPGLSYFKVSVLYIINH